MRHIQQEFITQKLTVGDPAIGFVNTDEHTIEYYGFITLGISGITLSMMGMIEMPLQSLVVTAVNASLNETTSVYRGLLVFGVKKYKSIF
jgi:hypothetical protein